MAKIWFGIIAIVAIAVLMLMVLRVRNDRAVGEIWRSLPTPPATEKFTPEMVADLPEPVRRYFLHAIQPGTPLVSSVQIQMHGSMKREQDWMPMQAEEILSTAGFLWRATIGTGLMAFVVGDRYTQQSGQVYVTLWGAIPIVNQQNPDITRASIGRLAIEYIWLPAVLLPQRGVAWAVIDENAIAASFKIDEEPITLTLAIDRQGRLLKVMMPRWGEDKMEKGKFAYLPYGAEFSEEATFNGYTVPSQMGVGWWFGTERYEETFRATVEQADYL
ncbi:MAG TPA: hypothetical protein DDZ80_22660 [Cyanobacteria bacterium UBA8803]|nr:hypothetical protein [Cyanobacteria bacterium UBA9273]HBL61128.1 hypothetical protein [Cyanobacteria bacterium UBA8803]